MDIFEIFRANANPEQAVKMSAYMRDRFTYLGIQTPLRRKLSRKVIKAQKTVDWVRGFIEKYSIQMSPLSIKEAGKYI